MPEPKAAPISGPWPSEIRLKTGGGVLAVTWEDGRTATLPAELLRCESPSAEVQGHSPSERRWVAGKRDVRIVGVDPVGQYAVRLRFDDGHSTGLYTWVLLAELGHEPDRRLAAYRAQLTAAGLSHEPG